MIRFIEIFSLENWFDHVYVALQSSSLSSSIVNGSNKHTRSGDRERGGKIACASSKSQCFDEIENRFRSISHFAMKTSMALTWRSATKIHFLFAISFAEDYILHYTQIQYLHTFAYDVKMRSKWVCAYSAACKQHDTICRASPNDNYVYVQYTFCLFCVTRIVMQPLFRNCR